MTSKTIRIHPLSDRQERRLLDYLDEKYLEIHQQYSRRSVSRGVACMLLLITRLRIVPDMTLNPNFPLFEPTFWRCEVCFR